jgi:hypothetical protein
MVRTRFRFIHWFSLGMLMSITLSLATLAQAHPSVQAPMRQDNTSNNLDLILLIDESGSAWDHTDPEPEPGFSAEQWQNRKLPQRIQSAQLLVNLLAAEPRNTDHRVAVYLFGTETHQVVTMSSVRDDYKAINEQIQKDHYAKGNMYWTDTKTAFTKAYEKLVEYPDPHRRRAVVIITDGRPETEEANLQDGADSTRGQTYRNDYLPQNSAKINEINELSGIGCNQTDVNPGKVFLLAVGQAAMDTEDDTYWTKTLGNHYRVVNNYSVLNGEVSLLAAQILCSVGGDMSLPERPPYTHSFTVPSNTSHIKFTIVRNDPASESLVTPPGQNKPITSETAGVRVIESDNSQVWSIERDQFDRTWAGDWIVSVPDGNADVQIAITYVQSEYSIGLLEPAIEVNRHPAGKPLHVVAHILNKENQPYQDTIQACKLKTSHTDTISTSNTNNADTMPKELAMKGDNGDATYHTTFDKPTVGQININVEATIDKETVVNMSPARTISIEKLPWMQILEPNPNIPLYAQDPFSVTVKVQSMGANQDTPMPVDAGTAKLVNVQAELRDANEVVGKKITLSPKQTTTGGTHQGTFDSVGKDGTYLLVTTLTYNSAVPPFEDSETVSVTIQAGSAPKEATPTPEPTPTLEPTPTPPPTSGGIVPLLVTGLAAMAAWWFVPRMMGPSLSGSWLAPENGGMVNLKGSRPRVPLFDNMGAKVAEVRLQRSKGASGIQDRMTVLNIASGQSLKIHGIERAKGEIVPLEDGDTLEIGGQKTTYRRP